MGVGEGGDVVTEEEVLDTVANKAEEGAQDEGEGEGKVESGEVGEPAKELAGIGGESEVVGSGLVMAMVFGWCS